MILPAANAALSAAKGEMPRAIRSALMNLEKVYAHHPDVQVFTLSIEPEMDENGFILPGIGDAGDRLYGTGDFI